LTYGQSEWDANASSSGFGRAREAQDGTDIHEQRFAVVYHLLSFAVFKGLHINHIVKWFNIQVERLETKPYMIS
jgi:NADH-quinone oxidoreductase subunit C